MKQKSVQLMIAFCFLALCSLQPKAAIVHIHWGSTGNPLSGLTITWRNSV